MRFAARLLVCAGLIAAIAVPAATLAKPERGKAFGDWVVDCETTAEGKERCFLSQTQTMQQQQQSGRLIKVSIGYIGPGGKPAMVAILPLGLWLPSGAAYQIEGQAQKPLPLQRCLNEGCIASAELDEAALGQMRKANSLSIGIKADAAGQTIVIPVSLKGFDAGLKSLR